jgi:hypothetical protein
LKRALRWPGTPTHLAPPDSVSHSNPIHSSEGPTSEACHRCSSNPPPTHRSKRPRRRRSTRCRSVRRWGWGRRSSSNRSSERPATGRTRPWGPGPRHRSRRPTRRWQRPRRLR